MQYAEIEKSFLSGELGRANREAQAAYRRYANSDTAWASTFRVELAKVLLYQHDNSGALALLDRPLPLPSPTNTDILGQVYLSTAQARLGQLGAANQTLIQVERMHPGPELSADILDAHGQVDMEKGDLDDAERQFQASLAAARLANDRTLQAHALLNLGHVDLLEEHFEDALEWTGQASVLASSLGAKLVLEKAAGNHGWAYYKLGDFQRALADTQVAEGQARELSSPSDQVLWLNAAGMAESRLGDANAARSLYEQALSLAQSTSEPADIVDAHVNLGDLLLRSGHLDAAEAHIREAIRVGALLPDQDEVLEPVLFEALLLHARGDRQAATRMLLRVEAKTTRLPSLRWKAENSLAQIYAEAGQRATADGWFRRSIQTFHTQRSSFKEVESRLPFLENGSDLYLDYMENLIQEHRPDEALSVIDESRAQTLADRLDRAPAAGLRRAQPLNARSIAARLQATVLVYSLRPTRSYLWAITARRQQFFQLPGSETIAPLLREQARSVLASRDLLSQPNAPGRALYDDLVKPAAGLIGKGGRVFILGDEGLSGLNFDTLQPPGGDPHYWIEDVTITNAKSLRLLSARRSKETQYASKRLLLMGDPVYRSPEWAALANAPEEVRKVAGHFAADRLTRLTGAEASPESYNSIGPGRFSYIHFVAHATANMASPMDSAVVLSGGRNSPAAYKLYARDILKQPLHADLVTLSACYGSGSRNYSGEGLVGLAWAFLSAGSHQVIGAMWDVSDVSTPWMMDDLYGELSQGRQPDAALRAAKLKMIHSGGVFRKPLYWAPFQLYAGS